MINITGTPGAPDVWHPRPWPHSNLRKLFADHQPESPLETACRDGDLERVKAITDRPDGSDGTYGPDGVNGVNKFNQTALMIAASLGNIEIVKELLNHGADKSIKCSRGCNALFYAVDANEIPLVELLLTDGIGETGETGTGTVRINEVCGDYEFTPLHVAIDQRLIGMTKFLLRKGAVPTLRSGYTPFFFAISVRSIAIASIFTSQINEVHPEHGITALMNAIPYGNYKVIRFLLRNGADVHIKAAGRHTISGEMVGGRTALHRAMHHYYDVSRVHCYSNECSCNKDQVQCARKVFCLIKLLMAAGSNPYDTDDNGESAMSFAVENGYTKLIALFESYIQ